MEGPTPAMESPRILRAVAVWRGKPQKMSYIPEEPKLRYDLLPQTRRNPNHAPWGLVPTWDAFGFASEWLGPSKPSVDA